MEQASNLRSSPIVGALPLGYPSVGVRASARRVSRLAQNPLSSTLPPGVEAPLGADLATSRWACRV